jgi:hypothetical protein
VHSPGGPSLLEAAAAAAVAAATAAAASSGAATADPDSTAAAVAAAAGGGSSSSSPSRAGSRKLAPVVSFGASGRQGSATSGVQGSAACGVQGSAELPPKPANWGKPMSFMARASDTSTTDVAQEGVCRVPSVFFTAKHAWCQAAFDALGEGTRAKAEQQSSMHSSSVDWHCSRVQCLTPISDLL